VHAIVWTVCGLDSAVEQLASSAGSAGHALASHGILSGALRESCCMLNRKMDRSKWLARRGQPSEMAFSGRDLYLSGGCKHLDGKNENLRRIKGIVQ
jgi:hypothetical protein